MLKKLFYIFVLSFLVLQTTSAAYEEIDCKSDPVFTANSCNQCFDWETKAQWEFIWLLKDDWINNTASNKVMYKEEQKMPNLVNLNSSQVTFSQNPSSDGFWEYTPDFEKLYSKDEEWYILKAWASVTWLQAKLWYAYKLDKNTAPANANIGLLVYPISTHIIWADWTPSIDNEVHRECVLFKSAAANTPIQPQEIKKLPQTWPADYVLLWILALLLWFIFTRVKRKA